MEFACFSAWSDLPDSADALFHEGEKQSIFLSRPWLEDLVTPSLDSEQSLLLACAIENGQLLGLLALSTHAGDHPQPLRHLYTSLHSLLLASQVSETVRVEALRCIAKGLAKQGFSSLRLDPVADDDRNAEDFRRALEQEGFSHHRHFQFHNWIHRLHGQSFDEYMATRATRVRNTIARKQRKLEREQDVDIHLYSDGGIAQALADYNEVYQASWKAHEQYDDFVKRLAHTLAERGWLRLAVMTINGEPAAAQFWFVVHGKASIFKLAYKPSWKHYSPGSILTRFLMRHVIEQDGVEEIDFLYGNDAYKQEWMSERRERYMDYYARRQTAARTKGRFAGILQRLVRWN